MMSSNTMNLPRSKDTKWLRWWGKSSSSTRWIRTGNNDARGVTFILSDRWVFSRTTKNLRDRLQPTNGDNVPTGLREIDAVSRNDRQTVDNRCRCDEAILDRHGFSSFAKTRQQFLPFQSGVRIPGKTVETPGPFRHDSL